MPKPEVTLANYEALHAQYEKHDQFMPFALFAHFVLGQVFRADVTRDDGFDDAMEERRESGTRFVFTPNHISETDPEVIVSTVQKVKSLHHMRGTTFIPSKETLLAGKGMKGKAFRLILEHLGAEATFRLRDLERRGIEITPEIQELYDACIQSAHETDVKRLIAGKNEAGFPEGGRNRVDFTEVQKLKTGITRTAIAAAEFVPVAFIPVGISYGGEPEGGDYDHPKIPGILHPHVHLALPQDVDSDDIQHLNARLHFDIQRSVDETVARIPVPEDWQGSYL